MSIATELSALQTDITNARTAITTKGGTVTSGGGSSQLATDIATIPSGGATEPYIEETYDASGNLTGLVMHGSISRTRAYQCHCCSSLRCVTLSNDVSAIAYSAFYNCSSLTTINLIEGLTTISGNAFYGCIALSISSLPSTIDIISARAFQDCSNLALTELPIISNSIGQYAFCGCTSLAITKLQEGTGASNGISSQAFMNCTGLINMEIACSITGSQVFNGCTGLQKVWFRSTCIRLGASSATNAPFVNCSTSLQIYCEATEKPSGYGTYFNRTGASGATTVTVVYGQTTRPW